MQEHPIWNPDTGITDVEVDPMELSVPRITEIKEAWAEQREQLEEEERLFDFTEKLNREWALETGMIEGLYEIESGVAQTLVDHGFHAELLGPNSTDKPSGYVLGILNDQNDAMEGILEFVENEGELSADYIKDLHAALLRGQDAAGGVDEEGNPVGIPLVKGAWKTETNDPERDGVRYTHCPPQHVDSQMDRMIAIHEDHVVDEVPPEVQAAWILHRFTQIRPFQHGNGRVARALASFALIKGGMFPLIVTMDDERTYFDALEAANEGNLKPLVDLVAAAQQAPFEKSSALTEPLPVEEDVEAALGGLRKAAKKIAADRLESLKSVFDLAHVVEEDLAQRLEALCPTLEEALERVSGGVYVFVSRSNSDTDYYFRAQIIENAKTHIGYYADTRKYKSWISLDMKWTRRARLVFTIHGVGKPFNGSLICAPFLQFRDMNDEAGPRTDLVPVAKEGFVFFFNEDEDRLLSRFKPWRENILKVALKEVTQNL